MLINRSQARLVIVDSEPYVRHYRLLIDRTVDWELVAHYDCIDSAVEHIDKDKPDVLLTEINETYLYDLKKLTLVFPTVKILVCSNICTPELIIECFAEGVSGYLKKDESCLNLLPFLRELKEGGMPLSKTAKTSLLSSYRRNPNHPLSRRETEILRLFSNGNSYSQIATRLNISPETSKTHIKNIYRKLGVHSKLNALKRAREEKIL